MSSLAMPSTVRKSQLGFASVSRTLAQSGVVPVLDVVPVLGHEDLRADHPESMVEAMATPKLT